jgi:hypothetical protein
MRSNTPTPLNQNQMTPEQLAETFASIITNMVKLKNSGGLTKILAGMPQPPDPKSAHTLMCAAAVVADYDLGQLVHAAEFRAWLNDGGADSPQATDRNGWAAKCLLRHWLGDWGEVDAEDWETNEQALKHGDRLLSAYTHEPTAERLWIITEANRTLTTLLFPSEY